MRKITALGVVGMLALVWLVGCDAERVKRLERENQELKTEMSKARATAEYDLQAKCSRDSKAWFNENWGGNDKETLLLTHTNHYNKSQNKCFIVVEYHYSLGRTPSWVNDVMMWDIYENSKYGTFTEMHTVSTPSYATEQSVSTCEMAGAKCKTMDQFEKLLAPYMTN